MITHQPRDLSTALEALDETWPETPTVKVLFSVQLLKEMAAEEDARLPRRIRLLELGEPDSDGFYEPTFQAIYDD